MGHVCWRAHSYLVCCWMPEDRQRVITDDQLKSCFWGCIVLSNKKLKCSLTFAVTVTHIYRHEAWIYKILPNVSNKELRFPKFSVNITWKAHLYICCITSTAVMKWTPFYRRTFQMHFFLNENVWIPVTISLKFVPKGPINNIPALVQIMAWRRSGDKPLSEPMMVSLPTHICVTRRAS